MTHELNATDLHEAICSWLSERGMPQDQLNTVTIDWRRRRDGIIARVHTTEPRNFPSLRVLEPLGIRGVVDDAAGDPSLARLE